MAKAQITVHVADLPAVQALLQELADIKAAMADEGPFPRTDLGDDIHNLRGRAEAAEYALSVERAAANRRAAEVLRNAAESAPLMTFDSGYPVRAVPVSSLLSIAALLDRECSGCSMPDGRHWDTCPNRRDGRPSR
jgi:hypothetical protein